MEMTIAEAERLRNSLAEQIMRLIQEYENVTGTQISEVSLNRMPLQEMGNYKLKWHLTNVHVRAELR